MNEKESVSFSFYTNQTIDHIATLFQTSLIDGLSPARVAEQQKIYGYNYIQSKARSLWQVYCAQFESPFIWLLCVVAVISMITDNLLSGCIVVIILILNSVLGCYLEYTAEQTVQSLKRYLNRHATVIRHGTKISIDAKELVPGDLVELLVGDVIAADVRFVEIKNNFAIDESIITGESEAVSKVVDASDTMIEQQFLAKNIGFSGSMVISGQARALVVATGRDSSLGLITAQFERIDKVGSFNNIIARFSTLVLYVVLISLSCIFAVHIWVRPDTVDILHLIMFGSALIAGIVPSSLPLITTFALSHGALRLKKTNTIVKRLSSIIDLGTITVLCTDKTGTLTENVLTVVNSYGSDARATLKYGALGGKVPFERREALFGFELALFIALGDADKKALAAYQMIDEIPFNYADVISMVFVRSNDDYELVARGGVEAVVARCDGLSSSEIEAIHAWEHAEGQEAHRVLAVAKKSVSAARSINDLKELDKGYIFVGILSLSDPIKMTAQEAIKKANSLGIELKILSGDSKVVCGVVAHTLGLIDDPSLVLTGAQFEKAPLQERKELVNKFRIFARVSPAHKYEIISLLQEQATVGYVGDGINDLLALRAAHVGIAVQEALDAVREVADIILLQKSLRSIINAIEEGRYAFVNTMKYIKVMLSANLGNFYSLAVAGLFLDYLPMLPVQILLCDLLSNLPLLTFATDRVSKKEVKRPNVSINQIIMIAAILGLVTTVFDFIYLSRFSHSVPATVQTGWFIWSVLSELIVIFSVRTNLFFLRGTPPSMLLVFVVLCIGVLSVILPYVCIEGWCIGQQLFAFVPIPISFLSGIGFLLCAYFGATEIVKLLYLRIWNGHASSERVKKRRA